MHHKAEHGFQDRNGGAIRAESYRICGVTHVLPQLILILAFVLVLRTLSAASTPRVQTQQPPVKPASQPQLKVFLDCSADCYSAYLRSEIEFVDYVRDRTEADVHVIVTDSQTGSGGREYTLELIGLGSYAHVTRSLKAVTTSSDPDDVVRRQLANALRVGLLDYVTAEGVPQRLDVSVELGSERLRPAVVGDRWNNWVFSLRGATSFDAEESQRQWELGASISADRITPEWKITMGGEIEHQKERFDIDDDEPFEVERRERDFNWLMVKALGEHWSAGAQGFLGSSTFENTEFAIEAAPAIEYNVFPYSEYTRRQLRLQYAIGPRSVRYYEETIFGQTEEMLLQHEISAAFEQTERWGSLQASIEWSQYLHDPELSRLEADGEVSWRVARGLSVTAEVNASRIRDQISLPRRGATSEKILLELRELQSGYEYHVSFGVTYTFGSIYSSIVNPRFGQ